MSLVDNCKRAQVIARQTLVKEAEDWIRAGESPEKLLFRLRTTHIEMTEDARVEAEEAEALNRQGLQRMQERNDLIVGLHCLFMEEGQPKTLEQIARAVTRRTGHPVQTGAVLRVLERSGARMARPGRRNLFERHGRDRVEHVLSLVESGQMTIKQAAGELDTSTNTIRRWQVRSRYEGAA